MSQDFDIYEFGKMIDAALASDNPSVQKALRNFMMICAMVHAEDESNHDARSGPFGQIFDKLDELERRMTATEQARDYRKYQDSYRDSTWVINPYPYTTTSGTSTTSVSWPGDSVQSWNYNTSSALKDYVTNYSLEATEAELEKQLQELLNKESDA